MNDAPPIATSRAGAPILYGALGATFHLEALVPEDAERLAQACDHVLDWIGPSLRWTWSSVHASVEPFAGDDLDLVSTYPGRLVDAERHAEPRAQRGASALAAAEIDRFGVHCHGGIERNVASPTSLRFYATAGAAGEDHLFPTRAMLAVTVPASCDLGELQEHALALASILRLRWGVAGLAYGAWEHDRYGETRDALYAHARRYPGYDLGQHATLMDTFHERVRTVSWLTFLGPALLARLGEGALVADERVQLARVGDGVAIRAGGRPEAGDANRRAVPVDYARVDRMIRPVRARTDVHFLAPWSERTSEAWLARFEGGGG